MLRMGLVASAHTLHAEDGACEEMEGGGTERGRLLHEGMDGVGVGERSPLLMSKRPTLTIVVVLLALCLMV